MIGTTVSHYRIIDKLGEGGMGVVYKAEDTRLRRTVALKFLHREAVEDGESRDRFLREAEAAASLDHPNICTVHGIEEAEGHLFIVMAFCEGSSLKDRIRERPLPLAEALDIAIQAAEGLRVAHEKGVVHRDLKPGNLALTGKGQVKVVDFGLAQLSGRTKLTRTGRQMGTPAYMSPEQAQGKVADRRSDLWSLGVVLYEMVASRLPFRGDAEAAVVHSILHEDPEPVTALRAGLPLELDRVLGKALAKDPGERYQHVEDMLVDLRRLRAGVQQETKAERRAAVAARRRLALMASLAGLGVGVAWMGVWEWNRVRTAPPPPVTRFTINLPQGQRIAASFNPSLEISPNGRVLFYMVPKPDGGFQQLLRRLDEAEPRTMASITGGVPVFSPDSQWVSFIDQQGSRTIRRAALSGGAPLTITSWEWINRGFWGTDNYLYWTPGVRGGVARTPITGGETKPVTELDASKDEQNHRYAWPLPGGREIVFTSVETTMETFDDAKIVVQSLDTGKRKTLVEGGTCPRYSPTGHLLYMRSGNVYAVPLDVKKLEVTGPPVTAVEGVLMSRNTGAAYYTLSETGTLAYVPGGAVDGHRQLVWVDRQGKETPLPLPPQSYLYPRLSPDGKQLALEIEGTSHDFYTYDFARGVLTKMSLDGLSHAPVWSPDGKRIGFRSWKLGGMTMWSVPADRSGPDERLLDQKGMQSVVSWSPDGNYIAYVDAFPGTGMDALVLPLKGERKPVPIARTKFLEGSPKFSPDGKWLAYCSNESGRAEVFVQPFPGPGPKIQVSTEGGTDPLWRRTGGELYYRSGDKMMIVEVRTQPTFTAGRPKLLWEGHYSHGMSSSCGAPGVTSFNYDVTPDGQRFLMVKDMHQDVASNKIEVVLNWTEELKRLAARKQ
jgi:serine/threonine-protein kinase